MKYVLERIPSLRDGRYIVKVPPGYPGTRYVGLYTYEHRAVYWLHHGELPPKGWVIHHINHDPLDNRIENLEALPSSIHSIYMHNGGKEPAKYTKLYCHHCGVMFAKQEQSVNFRKRQGQVEFYCSLSCQVTLRNHSRLGCKNNYPKNRKSHSPEVKIVCHFCKQEFSMLLHSFRARVKNGTKHMHCSVRCANATRTTKKVVPTC